MVGGVRVGGCDSDCHRRSCEHQAQFPSASIPSIVVSRNFRFSTSDKDANIPTPTLAQAVGAFPWSWLKLVHESGQFHRVCGELLIFAGISNSPHTGRERRLIFDEYEKRYGRGKREYAEKSLPEWRAGSKGMSGQTAIRLFNLLPPRMPLSAKCGLVENLWEHFGPKSKKVLRIGSDADIDMVVRAVSEHVENTVANYKIPDNLENRFSWLSAGDVRVKQELLNYFRQKDKVLAVERARAKIPVMLEHLRSDVGRHTHRLAEVLKIGKHELEITLDRGSSGVTLLEPSSLRYQARDIPWVWLIAA
jgi:hypothetical protein